MSLEVEKGLGDWGGDGEGVGGRVGKRLRLMGEEGEVVGWE